MLLRSSSTPVLGSLLSSLSESPGHTAAAAAATVNHHETLVCAAFKHPHGHPPRRPNNKLLSSPYHHYPMINFSSPLSCNSSPISPSFVDKEGFRRAQSDGNLQGLLSYDYNHAPSASQSKKTNEDEWSDNDGAINVHVDSNSKLKNTRNMLSGRQKNRILLETIPSFSFHNSRSMREDEDEDEDEDVEDGNIGMKISNSMNSLVLTKEEGVGFGRKEHTDDSYESRDIQETCPAIEHGGDCGSGGGGGFNRANSGGNGRDDEYDVEEHYRRMVKENPNNSLFLRNYAQFLYQSKRKLERAEEYYSRAILVDPNDGETLSQYAKLIWELHQDQERASSYFERAAQASPHDSHVHAAYASFLWEIEDEDQASNFPYTSPSFKESTRSASVVSA